MTTANDLALRAALDELKSKAHNVMDPGIALIVQTVVLLGDRVAPPAGDGDFTRDQLENARLAARSNYLATGASEPAAHMHGGPARLMRMPLKRYEVNEREERYEFEEGDYVLFADVEPFLQILATLVHERNHAYSRQWKAAMDRAQELMK